MIWVRGVETALRAGGGDGRDLVGIIACFRESDDVEIVQEDPEYFLGYVGYFFAPDAVGTITAHLEDESDRALGLAGFLVAEIGEESFGSVGSF